MNKSLGYCIINESYDMDAIEVDRSYRKNNKIDLSKRNERGDRYIVKSTLQRANSLNRNKRYYELEELQKAIQGLRPQEMVRVGMPSENGHPMIQEINRQNTIDPNNVVAYHNQIWIEGEFIKAYTQASNLHIGEALNRDMEDGYIPAWSLRALGSVTQTPEGMKVNNIKIITWDRVYYPSHMEAYTDTINESTSYTPIQKKIIDTGFIKPIKDPKVLDYVKEQSKNLKSIKESFEFDYDNLELVNNGTQAKMTDINGAGFVVNLESYISNEIRKYLNK